MGNRSRLTFVATCSELIITRWRSTMLFNHATPPVSMSLLTQFVSWYRYSFTANNCDYAARLCIAHFPWHMSGHVRLVSPFDPGRPIIWTGPTTACRLIEEPHAIWSVSGSPLKPCTVTISSSTVAETAFGRVRSNHQIVVNPETPREGNRVS